jgi:hypothetical protein
LLPLSTVTLLHFGAERIDADDTHATAHHFGVSVFPIYAAAPVVRRQGEEQ